MLTCSVWEHERDLQWLVGWTRKPVGLEGQGSLWNLDLSKRQEEDFGEDGQEGESGRVGGLSSGGESCRQLLSQTAMWKLGLLRKETLTETFKAAGRLRIVKEIRWYSLLELSCLDNRELKPLQSAPVHSSRSPPDGANQSASLSSNTDFFWGFFPCSCLNF